MNRRYGPKDITDVRIIWVLRKDHTDYDATPWQNQKRWVPLTHPILAIKVGKRKAPYYISMKGHDASINSRSHSPYAPKAIHHSWPDDHVGGDAGSPRWLIDYVIQNKRALMTRARPTIRPKEDNRTYSEKLNELIYARTLSAIEDFPDTYLLDPNDPRPLGEVADDFVAHHEGAIYETQTDRF